MILTFATIALLTIWLGLLLWGARLIRRRGWRLIGAVLMTQALLLFALQVALSTIPFGIGEPLIRVPLRETLLQTGLILLAIGGTAALLLVLGRVLSRWLAGRSRPRLRASVLLLIPPLLAAGTLYGMARLSLPERERERDPARRTIALPPGFSWSIYAQGTMDNPTAICFDDDGRLYIADIAGTLWVAEDADGDDVVDSIESWAEGFELLVGLDWHEGELYAASSGKVEALRDTTGDGRADQRRTVVDGLPSMILRPHSNNGLAFGPDGRLYFGVGSTTDGEVERHELAAAILSVNPDGSDLRVFARGLGNSFDVAFNSAGHLFAGDNSPSGGTDGEDYPDEFNHIVEGGHYCFPYFYGDPPENGGTRGALATFPPHSAPTGLTFYSGDQYPAEYAQVAFTTLWARGEIAQVEIARTAAGEYLSRASTFGSGLLYPIDVVTGPGGNLYVADFGTSAIYRITYDPDQAW
jgi:putative membrane-bound dehydrogenase-like protein